MQYETPEQPASSEDVARQASGAHEHGPEVEHPIIGGPDASEFRRVMRSWPDPRPARFVTDAGEHVIEIEKAGRTGGHDEWLFYGVLADQGAEPVQADSDDGRRVHGRYSLTSQSGVLVFEQPEAPAAD